MVQTSRQIIKMKETRRIKLIGHITRYDDSILKVIARKLSEKKKKTIKFCGSKKKIITGKEKTI